MVNHWKKIKPVRIYKDTLALVGGGLLYTQIQPSKEKKINMPTCEIELTPITLKFISI